jgi:hypothetical protein
LFDARVLEKLLLCGACRLYLRTAAYPSPDRRRDVMQVLFKSRDPQAAALRGLAERRLRFALRRLIALVPRAEVQLSDVNGPRGGVDKRCQLELKTDGAGTVVVSAVAQDWRSALNGALTRAARLLMRLLGRHQAPRRQRQRATDPQTPLG